MRTSNRRRVGIAAIVGSLLAVLALYLSGTPLMSVTSWQSDSLASGVVAVGEFELHWPLLAACAAGLLGLLSIVWPERQPARLRQ